MSNAIDFSQPVDDPLYAAHQEVQVFDDTILNFTTQYTSDYHIRGGAGWGGSFQMYGARWERQVRSAILATSYIKKQMFILYSPSML